MSNGKANEKATHHYNLGVSYEREGETENAKREYINSLKDDPYFPYPHKSLGELYYKKEGNLQKALEHLEKALKLDPDWIDARGLFADVLLDLGRTEEAIDNMDIALEGDPKNIHYLSQLGRMLVASGRYSEAIELLEAAAAQDPDNFKFQYSLALAFGKRAMSDVDRSIQHWERAFALNPEDPNLHRNMGIAYFTRGMLKESAKAFKRALQADPGDKVATRFLLFAERVEESE